MSVETLIFGIAPAWMTAAADPADVLRGASRSLGGKTGWTQKCLVVAQAALSIVLRGWVEDPKLVKHAESTFRLCDREPLYFVHRSADGWLTNRRSLMPSTADSTTIWRQYRAWPR
jgi:hypothetical protein